MKISDKDIRFIIYAAVFSLVIMGLMHIAVPQPPASPPAGKKATESVLKSVVYIDSIQIREKLAGDKPTFIIVYTSWCPYCHKAIPDIINIMNKGMLKKMRVLFISLDKDSQALAEYIAAEGYQDAFIPYVVPQSEKYEFIDMLKSKDSGFTGAIPYAALFDKDGKLVAETDSRGVWSSLLEAIKEYGK